MLFLFYSLLAVCQGGSAELPKDLSFSWSFPSTDQIEFCFNVPEKITTDYGWVGLGFKTIEDGNSMKNGDIVNIIFGHPVVDSYSKGNGTPKSDVEEGGTEDILGTFTESQADGYTVYKWTRPLDTGGFTGGSQGALEGFV